MSTFRTLGLSALASAVLTTTVLLSAPAQGVGLTRTQARVIAERYAPGVLLHEAFAGHGSGRRYVFEIRQHRELRQISVDPATGRIVEDVVARQVATPF